MQEEVAEYVPPSASLMWRLSTLQRLYFNPQFSGLENINPDKPALYVANHSIYGLIDSPVMATGIYKETGVFLRGLGDKAHFQIPGWGRLLKSFGAVEGTRENCRELMRQGEHVLVYPGGGREVAKRKGEEYKLTWKQRTGFARMAIEAGYDIIPIAAVGPDEMYDIIWDADDIMASPLGKLFNKLGLDDRDGLLREGDLIMPIGKGLGFTGLPKPETFYFRIGSPIDTQRFADKEDDEASLFALREEVSDAIYRLMDEAMAERDQNKTSFIRRFLTR